jgi:hypothetical protein
LEALQSAGVVSDDEVALFGENPIFPKKGIVAAT